MTYHQAGAAGLAGLGSASVTYRLTNTGNLRLALTPRAQVSGPFGVLPASADGDAVEELLPGSSVVQTVQVDGVWPLVRDQVRVQVEVGAAPQGTDPGLGAVSVLTGVWAVPWPHMGVLFVLALLLVARRVRRRRAAAAPAAATDPAVPTPSPAR